MKRDKKREELSQRVFQALLPYNKNIFGRRILTERFNYLEEVRKGIPPEGKSIFTLADLAERIIIHYKINREGGVLGLYNPEKISEKCNEVTALFNKLHSKILELPPVTQRSMGYFFLKKPKYKNLATTTTPSKKVKAPNISFADQILDIRDEFDDFTYEHNKELFLGAVKSRYNPQPIALIVGCMKAWRRLGRRTHPNKLRRYSKLYDFLKDIFDAFGFDDDVETAYNNYASLPMVKKLRSNDEKYI